jgi:5'-nucleotidase / UDP-sugar diphosphatase
MSRKDDLVTKPASIFTSPPAADGVLTLVRGSANPSGVERYLIVGDATRRPIQSIAPAPGVTLPPPGVVHTLFRLKILHINDLHGHIARLTPGPRPQDAFPILPRIVWRVRQQRAAAARDARTGVLFLTAGDDISGSAFDDLLGRDVAGYQCHASYRLYAQAGVHAGCLGNHDLDMGPRLLAHAIRQEVNFPLLAANLTGDPDLGQVVHPAALLVVKGLRVGLIGLLTGAQVRQGAQGSLHVTDPLQTVRNLLPTLRPLCDVVIILSHLGYSQQGEFMGDVELARQLSPDDVHLIIGGHSHHALNENGLHPQNIINGIPIVQAGAQGRFLGEVTITHNSKTAVSNARLLDVATLPPDEEFEMDAVRPLLIRAQDHFRKPLGRVQTDDDCSDEAVRNDFAVGELALANFVSDALVQRCWRHRLNVDFAMINASVLCSGVTAGETLTYGDWFNVMPYADTIRLYRLSGQQIAELLQDNARRACRLGEPHTERGFVHFSHQVRYQIDLGDSRNTARATNMHIAGLPLGYLKQHTFLIASHTFFRESALAWEAWVQQPALPLVNTRAWPYAETGLFLRAEIVAYIEAHGGVTAVGGARKDGRLQIEHETTTPYHALRPAHAPRPIL